MTESTPTQQILAATFATPDGASRAAAAVASSHLEKVANTAVLYVKPDGTPKFVESKDWGAGRAGLVGGAIGLIGGPLGVLAGSTIGVLASRLRDMGFKNSELERLGATLAPDQSAVVFDIATDAVQSATGILESLDATQIVTEDVDAGVAALFALESSS
ncbi:DUF1269 domain-containing protein [Microbacterium sp. DT81.1]|uniref:DUF1269 domain-containing protein n=1 Tax=Microbacterium sp. DT81.1 TaxID=3393413 RepID=UPI003CFA730D